MDMHHLVDLELFTLKINQYQLSCFVLEYSLNVISLHFHSYRPIGEGGKRSIFLANTKVLANQLTEDIRAQTPLRVALLTGDANFDARSGEKCFSEFNDNQV